MKKILQILIPFLVLGGLIFLIFKIKQKLLVKKEIELATVILPQVYYLNLQGDSVAINLGIDKKKYLFFFNSECEHCQAEALLIDENHEAFKDSEVYFLSNEPSPKVEYFKNTYLKKAQSFYVGKIDRKITSSIFGVNTFPYIMVYSKDNKLLKTYKGEVKLEALTNL
jgi:thiol-disulfide isomerase/thioredoxin